MPSSHRHPVATLPSVLTTSSKPARTLPLPDGRIAWDDHGSVDSPAVVLVPGLGDARGEYRRLVPLLVDAGYRVLAMDLRGHGESDTTFTDHSAEATGADVLALIEHAGVKSAVVVGCSFGAGAAAWAAAEAPERVRGLVLIGPFVRDIPGMPGMGFFLRLLFARPWGPRAWGSFYASLYKAEKPADFDDYRAALVDNLRQPGRLESVQAMVAASKAGVEARLGEVVAPTLVVMGSKDPDFKDPEAEARLVAERLRGAVAMIDGPGHYPHVERPNETWAEMAPFLSRAFGASSVGEDR